MCNTTVTEVSVKLSQMLKTVVERNPIMPNIKKPNKVQKIL